MLAKISVCTHALERWVERFGGHVNDAENDVLAALRESVKVDADSLPFACVDGMHYFRHDGHRAYFVVEPVGLKACRVVTVIDPTWPKNYLLPKTKVEIADEPEKSKPVVPSGRVSVTGVALWNQAKDFRPTDDAALKRMTDRVEEFLRALPTADWSYKRLVRSLKRLKSMAKPSTVVADVESNHEPRLLLGELDFFPQPVADGPDKEYREYRQHADMVKRISACLAGITRSDPSRAKLVAHLYRISSRSAELKAIYNRRKQDTESTTVFQENGNVNYSGAFRFIMEQLEQQRTAIAELTLAVQALASNAGQSEVAP